jgi:hypothetical protein
LQPAQQLSVRTLLQLLTMPYSDLLLLNAAHCTLPYLHWVESPNTDKPAADSLHVTCCLAFVCISGASLAGSQKHPRYLTGSLPVYAPAAEQTTSSTAATSAAADEEGSSAHPDLACEAGTFSQQQQQQQQLPASQWQMGALQNPQSSSSSSSTQASLQQQQQQPSSQLRAQPAQVHQPQWQLRLLLHQQLLLLLSGPASASSLRSRHSVTQPQPMQALQHMSQLLAAASTRSQNSSSSS